MSGVAFRAMRGEAHSGEKLGSPCIAEQVEEDGSHPAFAVVVVGLRPRVVIAVGNCTLADIKAQKSCAALDGQVQCGVLHTGLAREHKPDGQRYSRRIHHPVAKEPAIGSRKLVPPGTHGALPLCGVEGYPRKTGHHTRITSRKNVLGEEHHHVAVEPRLHVRSRKFGCPLRLSFHQREVSRIARGQHGEGVERAGDRIVPTRVIRGSHAVGQRPAAPLQNQRRLLAVVRRGLRVISQNGEQECDLVGGSSPPAGQGELASACLGFRSRQRPSKFGARVKRKALPSDAQQYVAAAKNAFCG